MSARAITRQYTVDNNLAFTGKGITSDPNIVQMTRVALEFYGVPEVSVPANGFVSLTAPSTVTTYTQDLTCLDVLFGIPCSVRAQGQTFTVTTSRLLAAGSQFQFRINNAIDNPVSVQPTLSFTMLTSVNEQQTQDMVLTCTPGLIKNLGLSPLSSVVGQSNTLEVRATLQSKLPVGGLIFLNFPKWNGQNPILTQQKSYIQGSPNCTNVKNLNANLTCDFRGDVLTIFGGVTEQISADTEIAFQVSGFRNPISAGLVYGFNFSTAITSGQQSYQIDQGRQTIEVTDYAPISQATLDVAPQSNMIATDTIVGYIQEVDTMQLSFFLPVPLDAGCLLTVELPKQYNISTVQFVSTQQVFGFFTQYMTNVTKPTISLKPMTVSIKNNSFTISPCAQYCENNKVAIVTIAQLKQPDYEKPTDSVKIFLKTQQGYNIASVEAGVTFTPLRGVIKVKAQVSNATVQALTNVTLTIQPNHIVYVRSEPEILVTFPSEISFGSMQCLFIQVTYDERQSESPMCSREYQHSVRIKNFLMSDYFPDTKNQITLTFGVVVNPISTKPTNGLQITILAFGKFGIDEYVGLIPWQTVPGNFAQISVIPTTVTAYKPNQLYTFTFSCQNIIPQNGVVVITLPPQISVPDPSYSQSQCLAVSGFDKGVQITCFFNQTQLTIYNAFRRSSSKINNDYTFTVPGLRNPMQTIPTSAFKFQSLTNDGFLIDETQGANVLMSVPATIQQVQVQLSSYQNRMPTNYTFTLVPSVPVTQRNFVVFTFPPEIILPQNPADLKCQSPSSVYISSITCDYDPKWTLKNSITVRINLTSDQIDALNRFTISFIDVLNPPSTQTTDSIEIRIIDSSNYIPINVATSGLTVTTNTAFVVSQASVKPEHYQPGIGSVFRFEITPANQIDVGGGLLITYPPQVTPDPNQQGIKVQANGVDLEKIQVTTDFSARSTLIANLIQREDQRLEKIHVSISGLRNPFTNAQTDSFKLQTFNYVDGKFTYFIDKADQGLSLSSKCSYPCMDCDANTPDVCTKCYPQTIAGIGLPYLQLGKCVAKCATSRFYNLVTEQCDQCDAKCLNCEWLTSNCTQCGVDTYLYLFKNKCLSQCPDGQLEDSVNNICIPCQNNCLTCENTVNTCTRCDVSSAFPYIYQTECVKTCPQDTSVLIGSKCVECDSSCKTCSVTPTNCTSCDSHMRFDPVRNICTQQCEQETQIFIPSTSVCQNCAQNCTKCAGSVTNCTQCKEGFVLNTDLSCKPMCGVYNQIPINGVCKECEAPCDTCTGQTDHCVTCLGDFKLYLSQQCVQYCPPKYQLLPPENLRCVYIGLVCPNGFKINQNGDGCVPIAFECQPGYEINEAKTACVPEPGTPVPFPFILSSVFVSFLVLGSYLKEKFFTKVLTCLIALIGMFEIIMYGLIVAYSIANQQWAVLACSAVGLTALIVSNITFVVYYKKEIVGQDVVFTKWLQFFPKTRSILPWACLLVNFKCVKMLYSGFFGLESSLAKFSQPLVFNKILRMITYFNFVFCYGAIFAADILIFIYVKWGYQLLILGVETFILQILILILTWREFVLKPEEMLGSNKGVYTQIKPNQKELRVKSGFGAEDSDYDQGIPELDERTLIRSKEQYEEREINLRKMALNKLLKQVGGVDSGLQDCFTKFDQERIKRRRAFSLEHQGFDHPWDQYSEGSSASHDYYRQQRFSYPMRKKDEQGVKNEMFEKQIGNIREAVEQYLIDNVYTDVKKKVDQVPEQKPKTVSRRTQTYLRELLQIEGQTAQDSDMEIIMDEAAEIDETYAGDLINKVIQNISDEDEGQQKQSTPKDQAPIQREIPEFELKDIMGTFEIDDLGNFIIIRGQLGGNELLDNQGRKVNRRGYLVDRFGNVINTQGYVIFKKIELDLDDEIPAPFGFEKKKPASIQDYKGIVIEPEQPAPVPTEVVDEQNTQQTIQSKQEEQRQEHKESAQSEDDEQIEQLVKKKKAKKRKTNKDFMIDNPAPQRFQVDQYNLRFPKIGVDNSEQIKLLKIARNIHETAQQMIQNHSIHEQIPQDLSEGEDFMQQHLLKRPDSVAKSDYRHNSQNRPTSGFQNKRSQLISAKPRLREDQSLQRIYGNVDDLISMEEQKNIRNLREEDESKIRMRMDSGKLNGLEQIYLYKNKTVQQPINFRKNSGRPTLQQFTDDPAELNVNTLMEQQPRYSQIQDLQKTYNQQVGLSKHKALASQQNLGFQNLTYEVDRNEAASIDVERAQSLAAQGNKVVHGNWM